MTTKRKTINYVWVLTREHNDHDQHGEYFEAVWFDQPTIGQLAEHFAADGGLVGTGAMTVMGAVALLEHIRVGGGRRGVEDTWYNLNKTEVKT